MKMMSKSAIKELKEWEKKAKNFVKTTAHKDNILLVAAFSLAYLVTRVAFRNREEQGEPLFDATSITFLGVVAYLFSGILKDSFAKAEEWEIE